MAIILDVHEWHVNTYQGYLEKTLFVYLAAAMPEEIFIYPENQEKQVHISSNIKTAPFPSPNGLFLKRKTNKWLRVQKATAFISFKRTLTTTLPLQQIIIISSKSMIDNEKQWHKATQIGFVSQYLKSYFNNKYPVYTHKTFLVEGIITPPKLMNSDVFKDQIKQDFTEGIEYFITTDFDWDKEKLITILKAFSRFKKRQQSNWKLMIVLRTTNAIIDIASELLERYKYRTDVVITNDERLFEKIAAAYSLISINTEEVFPIPIEEALCLHTPVIALETETTKAIYADLIIYPLKPHHEAIGDMMMMIYKGEMYRQNLIRKISSRSFSFHVENILHPIIEVLSDKLQQE